MNSFAKRINMKLSHDSIFQISRHFAVSFYNYLAQANSGLSCRVSLTALPGFYALRLPGLVTDLKNKSIFLFTLNMLKYIFLSFARPYNPPTIVYSIQVSLAASTLNRTLVIVLPSSYITQNFFCTFHSLLDSLSRHHNQHDFTAILFIAHDKSSFDLVKNLLHHKKFPNLQVSLDIFTFNLYAHLRAFGCIKLPLKLAFNSVATLLFSNRLKYKLHSGLHLHLALKTRLLCIHSKSFSQQLIAKYTNFLKSPPLIIELDNFNPLSSFYASIFAFSFSSFTTVLQWAIYGPEAIEWCGCSSNYIFCLSPFFQKQIREFFRGRVDSPSIGVGNIRQLDIKEPSPIIPYKVLNLLVLGPMDPWISNESISLTPILQHSIQQFLEITHALSSTHQFLFRPHPLDKNNFLLPLINKTKQSQPLFLHQSEHHINELARADIVISFFPSTLYITALELRRPVVLVNKSLLPKWSISWLPSEIFHVDNPTVTSFTQLLEEIVATKSFDSKASADSIYASSINSYFGGSRLDLLQQLSSITQPL
jgi:hypothetical protein